MVLSAILVQPGKLEPMTVKEGMVRLYQETSGWCVAWLFLLILYIVMLFRHARYMQPYPDLHSAVVDGKVEELRTLVVGSDLVFNILSLSSEFFQFDSREFRLEIRTPYKNR